MTRVKQYIGDCTQLSERPLMDMTERAQQITRRTFRRHVNSDELGRIERALGYARHPSAGLTMAGDWHVGYFKSHYQGRPCVYFSWSAFEHVFIAGRESWEQEEALLA